MEEGIEKILSQGQTSGCLNPGLAEKKCESCGKEYLKGVIHIGKKEVSYWYPSCNCVAKMSAELQARESVERKQKMERILKVDIGIGEKFMDATFENYDNKYNGEVWTECKKYVGKFLAGTKEGLFLIGPVGVGKTHLLSAIFNAIIAKDQGTGLVFRTMPRLLSDIKSAMKDNDAERVTERFQKALLLAIDDLGTENLTDWAKEVLYKIVNYRYEYSLPMIVSSNLNVDELTDNFDYRIISRLFEVCDGLILKGEDYRRIKTAKGE